MISRKLVKRLALVAAGWLLLAQVALAAGSCMMRPAAIPAQVSGEVMVMDDCIDAPEDAASCLVHCLSADQPASYAVDFQFPVFLPPIPEVGRLTTLPQPDSLVSLLNVSDLTGGPPLQVLFCSFQI
jgi:hypothetical protein